MKKEANCLVKKRFLVITLLYIMFFIRLTLVAAQEESQSLPIFLLDKQSEQGMGSVSQIDLYSGSFIQTFPFELPLGTNSLQPKVSAIYNSHLIDLATIIFLRRYQISITMFGDGVWIWLMIPMEITFIILI